MIRDPLFCPCTNTIYSFIIGIFLSIFKIILEANEQEWSSKFLNRPRKETKRSSLSLSLWLIPYATKWESLENGWSNRLWRAKLLVFMSFAQIIIIIKILWSFTGSVFFGCSGEFLLFGSRHWCGARISLPPLLPLPRAKRTWSWASEKKSLMVLFGKLNYSPSPIPP